MIEIIRFGGFLLLVIPASEFNEMGSTMVLMIEFFRVGQNQGIVHVDIQTQAYEVVVPNVVVRHHKEAKEALTQQHLSLLVQRRVVSLDLI